MKLAQQLRHVLKSRTPALVNAAVTSMFTPCARSDYWAKPQKERLDSEKERPLYSQPFVD